MNIQNPSAPQFSEYYYSASLGTTAIYVPASQTIVMGCYLNAVQDLSVMRGVVELKSGVDNGANSSGWIGSIECDGTLIGFKNINIASKTLTLVGLTFS